MNDLEICNAALLKLGMPPISNFDSPELPSLTAASLYPIAKKSVLSAHSWGFATFKIALQDITPQDVSDATHYALPSDFLRAIYATIDGTNAAKNYQIRDTKIISRYKNLSLEYIADVNERVFPPYFTQALIARLSADFCLPITDSTSRMETLYRISDTELQKARGIDSQQEPPQTLTDNSLLGGRG